MSVETAILEAVRGHLVREMVCEAVPDAEGRVACLTPLDYPNGDGVLVWAAPQNGTFEVTDYGEAYAALLSHGGAERRALLDTATAVCADAGVEFSGGRIGAAATLDRIGEAVWRVASASVQVAQIGSYYRPKRRHHEHEFVDIVHGALAPRGPIQREVRLQGKSGHLHRATFYVPGTNAVLEPVGADGQWSQLASAYAKLGDLAGADGYGLFAIIDNRKGEAKTDVANMLVQVSQVVQWTRRAEWLNKVV